ncbi:MAG: ABC transporter substrate-binding protein, partial [Gemmatimonadetes bacterium]|nr:ABC transporter substrate-binding protein [Gemmatimonadota bacterium]
MTRLRGAGRAVAGVLVAGLVAATAPVLAQAPAKMPRIGVTMAGTPSSPFVVALRRGLAEYGWVEGQNIAIEYRYAHGQPGRFPGFMAELVQLKVDLIVAGGGTVAALAAKQATTSVPVVMPVAADPVGSGLVASLARPGSNLTGLSMLNTELSAKRVELLKEALPRVTRVAMLYDPTRCIGCRE